MKYLFVFVCGVVVGNCCCNKVNENYGYNTVPSVPAPSATHSGSPTLHL